MRYGFHQNKDNPYDPELDFAQNSNFNNIGANFEINQMSNSNIFSSNLKASGYNKPIPKEVDDLFEDLSIYENKNNFNDKFNFNLILNPDNQQKVQSDQFNNEFPYLVNKIEDMQEGPTINVDKNKFSIFESGMKNSQISSQQKNYTNTPQINSIPKINPDISKNDQIDFSKFDNWNFPNNNDNIQSSNGVNVNKNNKPTTNIFNFENKVRFNNPSTIQNNQTVNVSNQQLNETLKLKSRQDAYKDKNPFDDIFQNDYNKKPSEVLKVDVNDLGKEYDNSSPVVPKENQNNEIYPIPKDELKNNDSKIVNIMDQNKGIDFDNILNFVELKDNPNTTNNIIANNNLNNNIKKSLKYPDENYDAYFNQNNQGLNKNKNENFFYKDSMNNFSQKNSPPENRIEVNYGNGNDVIRNLDTNSLGKHFQMAQALDFDVAYGRSKNSKEKIEEIPSRKARIFNDDHLSSIRNERNFVIERAKFFKGIMNFDEESLNIQIQDIFNDMLIKTDNIERTTSELQNYKLDETINVSPIGYLNNINKSLNDLGSLTNDVKREIGGSRYILNDGNGFYRAFIFSLLESYVLNLNLIEIKKFIFDFNTKIERVLKRKDSKINKDFMNLIFSLILDAMENRKIREAYEILIKSYLLYPNFDFALIKYMRLAIAQYLEENKNHIFNNDTQVHASKLLPAMYFTKEGFDLKSYLDEIILCMHYEADKFIFYISPIVFNINLELYILEGIANPLKLEPKYIKMTFPCLMGSNNRFNSFSSTISIFYRFCRYEKFYTNQNLMQNQLNITFSEFDTQVHHKSINQRMIILAVIPCEVCNRQSEFLSFSHMPGMLICKLCLSDFIFKILIKRVRHLSGESFLNKECKKLK